MSAFSLLDENLPAWWRGAINRLQPDLAAWRIGDPGAPAIHSADPLILDWCGENGFILLTNNRRSMPQHLAEHVANGRHIPGILVVDPACEIKKLAEDLALVAGASLPGEFQDQIRYLPLG